MPRRTVGPACAPPVGAPVYGGIASERRTTSTSSTRAITRVSTRGWAPIPASWTAWRDLVRGLRTERRVGLGDGRLQRLEQGPPSAGADRRVGNLGGVRARGPARGGLQVPRPGRLAGYRVDKADPFAVRQEVPAANGLGRVGPRVPLAGRGLDEVAAAAAGAAPPRCRSTRSTSAPGAACPSRTTAPLTYREAAGALAQYARQMHFTHVELLPVAEYPFAGSWGYQTTGFFAPTSRFGTPQDFMYLVDTLHQAGIGVILDWVPSHFPSDEHGLVLLRRHAPLRARGLETGLSAGLGQLRLQLRPPRGPQLPALVRRSTGWTATTSTGSAWTRSPRCSTSTSRARRGSGSPIASAARESRRDHVPAPLQRRGRGTPPRRRDDRGGVDLLALVTRPTYVGGLGFQMKWDLGWMNDTLDYMRLDPVFRKFHHTSLTFRRMYQYSEDFVLPLSHDEVVHLKASLLSKMPGDEWQKFAGVRLLLAYMWAEPGKKLLFMGGEIGQWKEWNHDTSLDWDLLEHAAPRRAADVGARPESPPRERTRAPRARFRSPRLRLDRLPRRRAQRRLADPPRGQPPDDTVVAAFNFTPVPRYGYLVGVDVGGTGSRSPTAMRSSTAARASAIAAARSRSRCRARPPAQPGAHAASPRRGVPEAAAPPPAAASTPPRRTGDRRRDGVLSSRTDLDASPAPSRVGRDLRYVCIHGHFYQPPRENPWLEAIESQPSRLPVPRLERAHRGRVLRAQRERAHPRREESHRRDRQQLRVDELQLRPDAALLARGAGARTSTAASSRPTRESQRRFGGHGSALAQPYNHMILPLCQRARPAHAGALGARRLHGALRPRAGGDVAAGDGGRTPRRSRSSRSTACASRFCRRTRRARRPRDQAAGTGSDATGTIDPTPRLLGATCPPGAPSLSSSTTARSRARSPSTACSRRASSSPTDSPRRSPTDRPWPQLVHVATDGETFGHHHRHGDRGARATPCTGSRPQGLARLTNYGEFLESEPPTHEVRILEDTSWSCAHGVERWRGDCGCQTGRASGVEPGLARAAARGARRTARRAEPLYAQGGERASCRTRGRRATTTSRVRLDRSSYFVGDDALPARACPPRPNAHGGGDASPSGSSWSCSGTRSSCTRAAAGSSTTSRASRPARSSSTPGAPFSSPGRSSPWTSSPSFSAASRRRPEQRAGRRRRSSNLRGDRSRGRGLPRTGRRALRRLVALSRVRPDRRRVLLSRRASRLSRPIQRAGPARAGAPARRLRGHRGVPARGVRRPAHGRPQPSGRRVPRIRARRPTSGSRRG